ncbi:MAG: hypothetical protein A2381_06125 [Bdellovibrionales bacterium RIFOXYB1_FULL_37_110]|nr:MAG: hypothetical protein A2417_05010 [Bdellovibrionales bacterium RIFOXYC1_FULL_37_79]OFZ59395.1 MAG: hypothetical protein A2381_06125 [Bdellovibrionales bacterium RIFOXYB1_FULL_37_110]OFZ61955.1 MAG: hypothetical protein A2577_18010 [Bdellovibrionales bacterium RIFOXYD1_FULL_36_51]
MNQKIALSFLLIIFLFFPLSNSKSQESDVMSRENVLTDSAKQSTKAKILGYVSMELGKDISLFNNRFINGQLRAKYITKNKQSIDVIYNKLPLTDKEKLNADNSTDFFQKSRFTLVFLDDKLCLTSIFTPTTKIQHAIKKWYADKELLESSSYGIPQIYLDPTTGYTQIFGKEYHPRIPQKNFGIARWFDKKNNNAIELRVEEKEKYYLSLTFYSSKCFEKINKEEIHKYIREL